VCSEYIGADEVLVSLKTKNGDTVSHILTTASLMKSINMSVGLISNFTARSLEIAVGRAERPDPSPGPASWRAFPCSPNPPSGKSCQIPGQFDALAASFDTLRKFNLIVSG
jgi:hypothetical protein